MTRAKKGQVAPASWERVAQFFYAMVFILNFSKNMTEANQVLVEIFCLKIFWTTFSLAARAVRPVAQKQNEFSLSSASAS